MSQPGRHAGGVLVQTGQLDIALHRHAECREVVGQHILGVVLRDHQQERIRAVQSGEVGPQNLAVLTEHVEDPGPKTALQQSFHQTRMLVELQRPGLHAQRPRLGVGSGRGVDDPHRHSPACQFDRRRQPARAGARDENIGGSACHDTFLPVTSSRNRIWSASTRSRWCGR